jgi:hypothetical protein
MIERIKLAWVVLFGLPLIGEGETTSRYVASLASKGLAKPSSLTMKEIRTICASALTQAANK